ncbi:MAG: hypothetical protein MZU95_09470 [Desulfomicrobium escambiense]|nr:hypothetical protein [Desulfomicrobium escambiense]
MPITADWPCGRRQAVGADPGPDRTPAPKLWVGTPTLTARSSQCTTISRTEPQEVTYSTTIPAKGLDNLLSSTLGKQAMHVVQCIRRPCNQLTALPAFGVVDAAIVLRII